MSLLASPVCFASRIDLQHACGACPPSRRMAGAIAGAALADAATMPLHWIYDVPKLTLLIGDKDPAFFDPPSCPFYAYDAGRNTPYGDQARTLLESIVDAGGFSPRAYAEHNLRWFGAKEYQAGGGYLDASTKASPRALARNRAPASRLRSH